MLVASCKSNGDANGTTTSAGTTASAGPAATYTIPPDDIFHKDPCRYVSQAEAEVYLGPLIHAPYRVGEDHVTGDSTASSCIYRAADGRSIEVSALWMNGKDELKQYTSGFLSKFFVDDKGKTDTLSDVWDQAAIRTGTLYALKGDTLFEIDYGSVKAGLPAAAKLAEDAIGRLGKPLAYNGGAATVGAPGALVTPRDPCTVLTRAEVEAVVGGPMTADPTADGNTACHYPFAGGTLVLHVGWTNGYRSLFESRSAMKNAHTMTNQQFFNMDSAFAAMHNSKTLAKMNKNGVRLPTANDSTVTGPWADSRVDAFDGSVSVVKKDVVMTLPLIEGKLDKAVALLTTAMNKI